MNNILNKLNSVVVKSILMSLPLGGVGGGLLCSCSDQFLEDKKNYDNVNKDIYDTYEGCNARVSDIYSWCLPDPSSDASWKYNCTGNADDQSKSTEEYSGFSIFTNPEKEMMVQNGASTVPDYFHYSSNNIQASVWGRIRNINDAISGISGGALSEDQKNELLGQVYFFRAWCYYQMVKWYGGVPIVEEVSNPNDAVSTPRSSTKKCIDFIVSDLDKAATMLSGKTMNNFEWGRITAGTALALKGRVLLLWASPIFNRANDQARWTNAYETMKSDLSKITACGYGLYSTGSNVNGSDFAAIFSQSKCNEDVFVTVFNTIQSGDYQKNNPWERGIRPKNATGSGLNPSAMIVDMFPMADGKVPFTCKTFLKLPHENATDTTSYEQTYPFMDRDPRFYRTFAFPGVRWAYNGDATMQDSNNPSYNTGNDYELWNYTWYTTTAERSSAENTGYCADNLLKNGKGMYVRKRSDDYDVTTSSLYSNWSASANLSGFAYDAAPYVEIRYAEVLLNLAEAACGAGHPDEAKTYIKQVRQRAGGNTAAIDEMSNDQATVMSAVLYERMVELAYEGKRFDDLRRWLLFDGGVGLSSIEGAPSTWKLTGWDGNTCTWLGFTALNGQRRENMEFRLADAKGLGKTTFDSDPYVLTAFNDSVKALAAKEGTVSDSIIKRYGTAAIWHAVSKKLRNGYAMDLRKPLKDQQQKLKTWYKANVVRKLCKGDGYDQNKIEEYIMFYPKYYLLGLPYGALSTDTGLKQTIGWQDTNNSGANGTFDPLAE